METLNRSTPNDLFNFFSFSFRLLFPLEDLQAVNRLPYVTEVPRVHCAVIDKSRGDIEKCIFYTELNYLRITWKCTSEYGLFNMTRELKHDYTCVVK